METQNTAPPSTLTPEQFYHALAGSYDRDRHVEHTIVKSVWYGKRTVLAKHEFIVIQVEDVAIPGLENYMVLDRNPRLPASEDIMHRSKSFLFKAAKDAFRISSNGDEKQLLQDCLLDSHQRPAQMEFHPDEPLLLLELVILARYVSRRCLRYCLFDSNCYWYAGLVWECMRRMRPRALYTDFARKKRGKFSFVRYTSNPIQIKNACKGVQKTIKDDESRLFGHENNPTGGDDVTPEIPENDYQRVKLLMITEQFQRPISLARRPWKSSTL